MVEKLPLGNRPQGLAVVDGALWVGVADTGARHRGGTLRIDQLAAEWAGATSTPRSVTGRSPRSSSTSPTTASPRTAARAASRAPRSSRTSRRSCRRPPTVAAPTRSALRRGIAYSTGRARLAEPHPLRHRAVGAPARCRGRVLRQPARGAGLHAEAAAISRAASSPTTQPGRSCSGSRSRTRICRTSWPCPSRSHCRRAWVSRHRRAERSRRPGPYRLAEFEPRRFLRLERNPRFRSWSATARPDGYPDAIVVRFGVDGDAAVDRVLDGRVDLVPNVGEQVPRAAGGAPAARAGAVAREPRALHHVLRPEHQARAVRPARRRRAVSFALDRSAAVTAAGGPDVARETCQLLPPGFPGSRPYCPFSRAGDRRCCRPSRPREGAPARAAVGHERDARDRARPDMAPAGPPAAHDADTANARLRRGAALAVPASGTSKRSATPASGGRSA